jgi:hypothetical protein
MMASVALKDRVAALEAEVARLKVRLEGKERAGLPWWEKIAGTFANDPMHEEALRYGRQWRESFRPKPSKRTKN